MTGYQSKRAAAQDKLVVTDIDGHVVRDVRKPKKAQPAQKPVAWLEPEWGEKICPEVGYEVTMTDDHPRDLGWIPLVAQPAQEPVAWLQIGVGPLHEGDVLARTTKPKEWNPKWWKFEPLYTAPPQRPWVGLTDEEAQWLYDNCRTPSNLIDMVEAKLKERNA